MKEDVTEKSDQIRHGFIEDPTKGPRVEILIPALHLQDRQREGSCSHRGHWTTALTWHQNRPGGPQDSGGSADTPAVFLSHDVGLHVPLAPLKLASPPASPPAVLCPRPPATPLPWAMAMFTELSPSWFHPSSYSALLPEKFSKKLPSACRTGLLVSSNNCFSVCSPRCEPGASFLCTWSETHTHSLMGSTVSVLIPRGLTLDPPTRPKASVSLVLNTLACSQLLNWRRSGRECLLQMPPTAVVSRRAADL